MSRGRERDSSRTRRRASTGSVLMDYLPVELMTEILTMLPVKSLLQLKSVCKAWYALINSPDFTTQHRIRHCYPPPTNSTNNFGHQQLLAGIEVYGPIVGRIRACSCSIMSMPIPTTNANAPPPTRLDFPFFNGSLCFVAGTCHGLVCIGLNNPDYQNSLLFLCNPATKQFRAIPPYNFSDELDDMSLHWHSFGFGFDPSADDYKLIRILFYDIPDDKPELNLTARAEMYTMSTDTWREVKVTTPLRFAEDGSVWQYWPFGSLSASACLNGVFYWEAFADHHYATLLSFDTVDEVLRQIATPECCDPKSRLLESWGVTRSFIWQLVSK